MKKPTFLIPFFLIINTVFIYSAFGEAEEEGKKESIDVNFSELLEMRDPFRQPIMVETGKVEKAPLERFSLSELRVQAIVTGPVKIRALVETPDGKTYFIAVNDRIGLRGGTVTKILPGYVLVTERLTNVIGQSENIQTQLKIQRD